MTRSTEGLPLGLAAGKCGAVPGCLPIVERLPGGTPLLATTGAGAPDSEVRP